MTKNNREFISTISFSEETLAATGRLLEAFNITYLIDSEWDYAYTGPTDHPILNNLDPLKRAKNVELHKLSSIIKILILTSDDRKEVLKRLSKMKVVVHIHGDEGIFDISPEGIDKWSGLQQLGVKEREYIAFGNDSNDRTMFQHAGHTVMIGDNQQLKPFASEQLFIEQDIERKIINRLDKLASPHMLQI